MNIILLSGGSGKRLWPLSNEVRSKQFLKVFKKADGTHESMLQRMYRMICDTDPEASITIATSENQVSEIRAQLNDKVDVSVEPCRRDTFPAIALATAYLHDVKGVGKEEAVLVCPVDPFVEEPYFEKLNVIRQQAERGEARLVLMGVEPFEPSEKYGYILPKTSDAVSEVVAFKEKPSIDRAKEYISQGALWNAGVFSYRIEYVLKIAEEILGASSYQEMLHNYATYSKISFDYAVVEKESRTQVVRFDGKWEDLGTWNALTEAMSDEVAGKAIAVRCEKTHIINELQIPMIALGVKNLAIIATPDGILVVDKEKSDELKDYVTDNRPMFEKRVWGEYQVLDYRIQNDGQNFLTKHLVIWPGKHISYQLHRHRTEMWTFVDGSGELILDGKVTRVERGDTAYIVPGMKHAIKANTELHIIEVQVGDVLTEEDIERLDWDWN